MGEQKGVEVQRQSTGWRGWEEARQVDRQIGWSQARQFHQKYFSSMRHHCRFRESVKVAEFYSTLCNPMDSAVHGILQARILEWVAFPFSRGSSQLRDRTQGSRIAGKFFTSWGTRKPKNTGVGSLSLLQQIFLTQELNQGLLQGTLMCLQ